ncbi:protein aurora borealis [Amia ocellicauda]|uniref:protein aurora borealis n=1 Tax=Amia ocellicauda TaxID=2972642 RepID=UPI0034640B9F
MEDVYEMGVQITPETPGRPAVLNPFESPNDYHSLHESVVASPSLFKCSRATSATPAKFKWSIDEIASLHPVDIDPEDIHRQSLYLSQTRTDKDIEERRQNAIEQFFTKNTIVPSPWAEPESRHATRTHTLKCSVSPVIPEESLQEGKSNAGCQTMLSLPVDFDLEKILGDYVKPDDAVDQMHESLSSSSLRRKLFLDGNGSGSDSSSPASPDRGPIDIAVEPAEGLFSVDLSPLQNRIAVATPNSGQFSSSPIQGSTRACSLGSLPSPMFPDRSSPSLKSPTLSPIIPQAGKTPGSAERRRLNFRTPDGAGLCSSNTKANHCTESPYVEGCSPIQICSPARSSTSVRTRRYRGSPFQLPFAHELSYEEKENFPPTDPLPPMDTDACCLHSDLMAGKTESCSGRQEPVLLPAEPVQVEEAKENNTVNMGDPVESAEDESTWAKDGPDNTHIQLTSSRTGSISNVENSHMFISLLAESSAIPCDGNSMQVDSGYNTYSVGVNSIMDGAASETQPKDLLDGQTPDETFFHTRTQHFKSKFVHLHH